MQDNYKELREKWLKDFGNPPLMLEELTKGMSRCALCGIKAEQIADWWLNELKSQKEKSERELVEKIEEDYIPNNEIPYFYGEVTIYRNGIKYEKDRIINLIKGK